MFMTRIRLLSILIPLSLAACAGPHRFPADPVRPFGDSRFIQVENVRMHYRDRSPGWATDPTTVPTLVLVHGLASNSATWDRIVPAFRKRYRIVRIDL